jgi:hypothetical protein
MRRVSSFCRSGATKVYSPVISRSAWPAIFEASIALPPTSCRQVMLARPKECGPKPGKQSLHLFVWLRAWGHIGFRKRAEPPVPDRRKNGKNSRRRSWISGDNHEIGFNVPGHQAGLPFLDLGNEWPVSGSDPERVTGPAARTAEFNGDHPERRLGTACTSGGLKITGQSRLAALRRGRRLRRVGVTITSKKSRSKMPRMLGSVVRRMPWCWKWTSGQFRFGGLE